MYILSVVSYLCTNREHIQLRKWLIMNVSLIMFLVIIRVLMLMLFYAQRILAAADFLQNTVSINVQLMEEEKACFYCFTLLIFLHYALIVNFIDFDKAFDSIHRPLRPAFWKILKQWKSSPSSRNSMKRATVQSELTVTQVAGSRW